MNLKTCDEDPQRHLNHQNKVLFCFLHFKKESSKAYSELFHLLFPKDTEEKLLKEARLKLEDVTFDIQCFISENAQFLSPAQSSYLLKFLTSTQRALREQTERIMAQRSALDVALNTKDENQEVCLVFILKRAGVWQNFRESKKVCQKYKTG